MSNGGISNNTCDDYKSGSTQNDEIGQVHNSVPTDLKTLIRIVLRTFYDCNLFLCMEMLMLYPCMKEEDLAELLRQDLKVVREYLLKLIKEKFINTKSIMETNSSDGKQSKHSCYYINYTMMVNVIKYKLDKIRIQIESEVNQFATNANFKCTNLNCKKTYSDLDMKDILSTMQCKYCGAEVDEDTSPLPTRNLLNTFNTQMKVIFELLSKVEHIRLADCILRPDLVDMTEILESIANSSGTNNSKNSMQFPNESNLLSTPSNLTNLNNFDGQSANLETIIMQKMLKYEKNVYEDNKRIPVPRKLNSDEMAINDVGNQIHLINNNMNTTEFEQDEPMLQKSRRLNNGGMLIYFLEQYPKMTIIRC